MEIFQRNLVQKVFGVGGIFSTKCFPKRFLFFDGNVSKECFPKSCLLAVREGLLLQYLLFERVLKCISAVPATFQNIS